MSLPSQYSTANRVSYCYVQLCTWLQAAGLKMPVDGRIKGYIRQLVADGIQSVAEVARHAESFVKHQLFSGQALPSRLNRRYFPTRRDVTNIIYRERVANMHSVVDQDNLLAKMKKWSEGVDDMFFFRPYTSSDTAAATDDADDEDDDDVTVKSDGRRGLLLVHQTGWQRRLLNRYGSICLLDATYKTTRYAVPLFFLCVRTNVDYVVVATFVTQYEDSASIAEALHIIRQWNNDWTPQSFMVDFCEPEIMALEQIFDGKKRNISAHTLKRMSDE